MSAMASGLKKLDVDLKKTDFFITHLHVDHSGLASSLATDASTVFFNQKEADLVNKRPEGYWREMFDFYAANGFPQDELETSAASHPGRRYRASGAGLPRCERG